METSDAAALFSEELGWFMEVHHADVNHVLQAFEEVDISAMKIGESRPDPIIDIHVAGKALLSIPLSLSRSACMHA